MGRPLHKLTLQDIEAIKQLKKEGWKDRPLAEKFNCDRTTIVHHSRYILRGEAKKSIATPTLQRINNPKLWHHLIKENCVICLQTNKSYFTKEERYTDRGNFCGACNSKAKCNTTPNKDFIKALQEAFAINPILKKKYNI